MAKNGDIIYKHEYINYNLAKSRYNEADKIYKSASNISKASNLLSIIGLFSLIAALPATLLALGSSEVTSSLQHKKDFYHQIMSLTGGSKPRFIQVQIRHKFKYIVTSMDEGWIPFGKTTIIAGQNPDGSWYLTE